MIKKKTRPEKKSFFTQRFCAMTMVTVTGSLIGFLVENTWLILRFGYIDNRNMCLPLLLGYGLAMMAVYRLFGTPDEPRFILKALKIENPAKIRLIYLLLVFVCITAGESLLGYGVEFFTGIQWWNYEALPFNIGRYTSIPTSIAFSAIVLVFMDLVFMRLYNLFYRINPKILKFLSLSLLFAITADFINSAIYMLVKNKLVKKWKVVLFDKGLYHIFLRK